MRTYPTSYMESDPAINAFKELFLSFFNIKDPVIDLNKLPFWSANVSNGTHITGDVLLMNGCFFNFSSKSPTQKDYLQACDYLNEKSNFSKILIPHVRGGLKNIDVNFHKDRVSEINASCECIFSFLNKSYKTRLIDNIGVKKYKDLLKYYKKAHNEYDFAFYDLKYLMNNQKLLSGVDTVCMLHEKRYGHKTRVYGKRYFKLVSQIKELAHRFIFGIRTNKNGEVIQVIICLNDRSTKTVHILSQAIRTDLVPKSQNLYKALCIDVYEYAQNNGFTYVNLGRNNPEEKQKLGANILIPHSHLLIQKNNLVDNMMEVK